MDNETDDLITAFEKERHTPPAYRVQQWHDAVDSAAALEKARSKPSKQPSFAFLWGFALASVLAVAIGIGFGVFDNNTSGGDFNDPIVVDNPPAVIATPVAFTRGLQTHLRDTQRRISNLGDGDETTILVLRIVEQNRMFESFAEQNDANDLARVLRAFEPILLELAATETAPAEAEALRAQLEFELKVMLTKLANDTSDSAHTT